MWRLLRLLHDRTHMLKFATHTSIGVKKQSNEDSYCVMAAETLFGEAALAIVCDGVGGLSAGDVASATVAKMFACWFEDDFADYLSLNIGGDGKAELSGLEQEWKRLLDKANNGIHRYGSKHEVQLGTTASALLLFQGQYFIGHVGDCRIYRMRDGALQVLTQDQTFAARELLRGNIDESQLQDHPKRNVLLQAVGTQEQISPDFCQGEAREDDLFMLCCDGLYRVLPQGFLETKLAALPHAREDKMRRACAELVQASMDRGETDNITICCLTFASMLSDEFSSSMEDGSNDDTMMLGDDDTTSYIDSDDDETVLLDEQKATGPING